MEITMVEMVKTEIYILLIVYLSPKQGCKSMSSIGGDDQHILVNFLILGG